MEFKDGAVEISKEPMLNGYHIDLKYGESAILGDHTVGLKATLWLYGDSNFSEIGRFMLDEMFQQA